MKNADFLQFRFMDTYVKVELTNRSAVPDLQCYNFIIEGVNSKQRNVDVDPTFAILPLLRRVIMCFTSDFPDCRL